jgi:hypothetical protein
VSSSCLISSVFGLSIMSLKVVLKVSGNTCLKLVMFHS